MKEIGYLLILLLVYRGTCLAQGILKAPRSESTTHSLAKHYPNSDPLAGARLDPRNNDIVILQDSSRQRATPEIRARLAAINSSTSVALSLPTTQTLELPKTSALHTSSTAGRFRAPALFRSPMYRRPAAPATRRKSTAPGTGGGAYYGVPEDTLVYVNRGGKRYYHRLGCPYIEDNNREISVEQALHTGYRPDPYCHSDGRR